MTIEHQNLFTRMMTPLLQAQQSVVDLFFKNRLDENTEHAVDRYVQYRTHLSNESQREYIRSLKELGKILEEIIYLEKGDAIQLAMAYEQVLLCLYNFLKEIQIVKQTSIENEVVTKSIESAPRSIHQQTNLSVTNIPPVRKINRDKDKLSETQEKILEFVRREPDCRTKDVVSQFSALSQRTIKRGLKELREEGRIIKRLEGGAAYYSIA